MHGRGLRSLNASHWLDLPCGLQLETKSYLSANHRPRYCLTSVFAYGSPCVTEWCYCNTTMAVSQTRQSKWLANVSASQEMINRWLSGLQQRKQAKITWGPKSLHDRQTVGVTACHKCKHCSDSWGKTVRGIPQVNYSCCVCVCVCLMRLVTLWLQLC